MQKAKEILLKAKKNVFNEKVADLVSFFDGDGLDFKEIKEYSFGDDVKKINWKASARNEELKINVFNENRALNVVLVFMASGSMNFGSIKLKQEVAAEIFAILGFSSVYSKNLLFPLIFSEQAQKIYKPTYHEDSMVKLVDDVLNFDVLNKSVNYENLCFYLNEIIKKKSIVFIISDFFDEVSLSQIAYQNEVYAIVLRDRVEEFPSFLGEYNLINPNSSNSFDFNITKNVRKNFAKLIQKHDLKLKEHFLKHKIRFGKIYTDDDVFLKLLSIVRS